jgi:hypothetical protein
MKLVAPLILLVLSAGLLTAAPITITSGSIVITGNSSGTFHLVSDTFDLSGTLFNPNGSAGSIFPGDISPFIKPGDPISPQVLGDTFAPDTGSGTINRVYYDSLSFNCLLCPGSGSLSSFNFNGPPVPFESPVFTAPSILAGFLSVYSSSSCLICNVPWAGLGIETVRTQLFPNNEYGYVPPLEYDFVPEPGSVLLTAGGLAVFLLLLFPCFERSARSRTPQRNNACRH